MATIIFKGTDIYPTSFFKKKSITNYIRVYFNCEIIQNNSIAIIIPL